jgi:predicted SnoaL-like aldol condensation-catalyzing enzyme
MSEKPNRKIVIPQSEGFFQGLSLRFKLILRLLGDSRVSPILKVLPIGSLVYLVMPDIAPGPIDDAAVIWLATYLFVELGPPNVVQEHLDALNATRKVMDSYEETSQADMHGEVIDGEIVESDPEEK